MGEIKIEIIDENPKSKFGLPTGERQSPLSATIVQIDSKNLETYKDSLGLPLDDRKEPLLNRIENGTYNFFVAVDPDTENVAGFLSVNPEEDNVLYVEVNPSYKGRKVGPQLITSAQKHFSHLKLDNVIGPDGERFYANLGFVREGMPGEMSWHKTNT